VSRDSFRSIRDGLVNLAGASTVGSASALIKGC
jgi:hypothetical protein